METLPVYGPVKGQFIFALSMTWIALCTTVLILRFWSRLTIHTRPGDPFSHRRLYWDDWLALAAWPFILSALFLAAYSRDCGMGRHVDTLPPPRFRRFLQDLYAMYHTYDFAVGLSRMSALFFYRRVFGTTSRTFVINFWTCLAANAAWLVIMSFVALFNCVPVNAFWDRALPGYDGYTCIGTMNLQLGHGVTSVVIDLWLLLIPMPFVLKLQMTTRKKLLTVMVFVFAYCAVVFTIGRTASVFVTGDTFNTDVTWGFVTSLYWFVCETSVLFISISLPSLLHLYKRFRKFGFGSLFNNRVYGVDLSSSRSKVGSEGQKPSLQDQCNYLESVADLSLKSRTSSGTMEV